MIEFIRLSMYPREWGKGKTVFRPLCFHVTQKIPPVEEHCAPHRAQHRKGSDPGQ